MNAKSTSKPAAKSAAKSAAKPAKDAAAKPVNPQADARAIAALQGIESGERAILAATLEVFRACASGAQVTADTIAKHWPSAAESSRIVYASEFSAAGAAAGIIGEAAALKVIDEAAKLSGRVKVNVVSALRAVRKAAKDAGITGTASKAQAARLSTGAVKVARTNASEVKVKAKAADAKRAASVQPRTQEGAGAVARATAGTQVVVGPKSACAALLALIGTAKECAATVAPERRKLWDEGVKALAVAYESLALAAK